MVAIVQKQFSFDSWPGELTCEGRQDIFQIEKSKNFLKPLIDMEYSKSINP
jgi:hypothetical protein